MGGLGDRGRPRSGRRDGGDGAAVVGAGISDQARRVTVLGDSDAQALATSGRFSGWPS